MSIGEKELHLQTKRFDEIAEEMNKTDTFLILYFYESPQIKTECDDCKYEN